MKLFIPATIALFSLVFLSSCTKSVIYEPGYPSQPQDPIVGSWILTEAAEQTGTGWYGFNTGLESGVFRFYSNGTAQHSDAQGTFEGNWRIQTVTGDYNDEHGTYYYGTHETLELHMTDYRANDNIHLPFEYVVFYNNSFTATYYNGKYVERYRFRRY